MCEKASRSQMTFYKLALGQRLSTGIMGESEQGACQAQSLRSSPDVIRSSGITT